MRKTESFAWVVTVVVLINLFVISLAAISLNQSRRQFAERAVITTRNLSNILDQSLGSSIDKIDLALSVVSDEIKRQTAAGGVKEQTLDAFIERQKERIPIIDSLRTTDSQGMIRYGTAVGAGLRVSAADRDYFIRQRDNPQAGLFIGKPVLGKISRKWVLPVSRRLDRPNGSFGGAVLAYIALEHFSRMFSGVNVGEHGAISLFDDELGIVARYPEPQGIGSAIGLKLSSPQFLRLFHQGKNSATYVSHSSVDGIERTYSYRRISSYPLYVIVGLARTDYLAEWRGYVVKMSLLTIFFLLASLFSLWLAHRRINERRAAERHMKTLSAAVEQSSDWILISNVTGQIEYVNDVVERMTGYTKEEILGKTPRVLRSGIHDKAFYKKMWDTILSGKTYSGILTNRKKNGELFEVFHTITPIRDSNGKITHFVATSKDITALKQLEERINFLAYYDDLTGLPNRALLMDRLKQAMGRAEHRGKYVGVLLIDIDRFHLINDTLGVHYGDVLLNEVSSRLAMYIRDGDSVARLGSDEFSVVFNDVARSEDVILLLEELTAILCQPIVKDNEKTVLTFSIGVTLYPNDAVVEQILLQNADMACQQAKLAGGNNYRFFTQEMNTAASEFVIMERDLKNAVAGDEFVLHYQPYWDAGTRNIVGMETLIRWRHKDGLVQPGKFIHVLEETGMIIEVGEWVIKTAIRQLKEWKDKGYPVVPVSVNLSLVQFRQKDVVAKIKNILQEFGLPPSLVTAEITESAFMEDIEFTRSMLTELRDSGISISIDDFGTGYSSLSYLKKLPVDNLKIDISFIRELGKDPDAEAIVSAIITMAKTLNLKTIAEGVETAEQWNILGRLGCDTIQGFYAGHPLPAGDFEELLKGVTRPFSPGSPLS